MSRFDEIRDLLMAFKADFEGYENKPNKTTGRRVMKAMERVSKKAQSIRREVQKAQDIRVDVH